MAFNPFDVFRRNQRILFAVLTVVVMFMFVLSFGQGDFFSQVPRWLAQNRRSGTVLAELNGSKVYSSELEQVRGERVLANQYMAAAARRGAEALRKYVGDSLAGASAEAKPALEQAIQGYNTLGFLASEGLQQNPQLIGFFLQQVEQAKAGLATLLAAKSPKQNDLELANAARSMLSLMEQTAGGRAGHYFFNQPNASSRDVMDFLLWRAKADQLGIRLDDRAVVRLANDEFGGKLGNDDWRAAEEVVRGKQGFTPGGLLRAVGDEFRVRAAQAAVLGTTVVKAGAEFDAPYDYYKFYRDQTNSARYGMVVVPADNYLDRVAGQPTDAELQELFRKGAGVEPNPRDPRIGLKEPRRVKLAFVEATGAEPFYAAKAEAAVKAAEAAADPSTPAGTATTALAGPAVLAGGQGPAGRQYARYKEEHARQVANNWGTPTPFGGGKPLDTHILEPVNLAAMTAAFAAGGSPLVGPVVLAADGFASDRIAKLESVLPVLIAPTTPGVAGLAGVLGSAGGFDAFLRPLPAAAVRGVLLDRAREELARQQAGEELQTFGADVTKLAGKADEARAKVEAFSKERGLKGGGSAEFRDLFGLAGDPGLKPLEDRFQADNALQAFRSGGFVDPLQFSARFFFEPDPTAGNRSRVATGLFKPQAFPEGQREPLPGQPLFLVWRADEKPAEAARTLNDPSKNLQGLTVRDKAVAGWKRQKARELARKDAEEISKRAGGFGQSSVEIEQKLRDEAAKLAGGFAAPESKQRVQYFEIDRVAPLATEAGFQMGRQAVAPWSVPRSAFLPYPSQEVQDTLLANRAKPPATAAVVADLPGDRQYVAVLVQKTENSADAFGLTVYGPTAQFNELARAVRDRHQEELRRENRDRAVSLLKAEFRYDRESDELNRRSDAVGD